MIETANSAQFILPISMKLYLYVAPSNVWKRSNISASKTVPFLRYSNSNRGSTKVKMRVITLLLMHWIFRHFSARMFYRHDILWIYILPKEPYILTHSKSFFGVLSGKSTIYAFIFCWKDNKTNNKKSLWVEMNNEHYSNVVIYA